MFQYSILSGPTNYLASTSFTGAITETKIFIRTHYCEGKGENIMGQERDWGVTEARQSGFHEYPLCGASGLSFHHCSLTGVELHTPQREWAHLPLKGELDSCSSTSTRTGQLVNVLIVIICIYYNTNVGTFCKLNIDSYKIKEQIWDLPESLASFNVIFSLMQIIIQIHVSFEA